MAAANCPSLPHPVATVAPENPELGLHLVSSLRIGADSFAGCMGPQGGPHALKGSTGEPFGMAANSSELLAERVGFERSTGCRATPDEEVQARADPNLVAEHDPQGRAQATHGRASGCADATPPPRGLGGGNGRRGWDSNPR